MRKQSEFHLRLPYKLYRRIKKSADSSGISTNAWILGVLEATVDSKKFLMRIIEKEDGTEYEITVPEEWTKKKD